MHTAVTFPRSTPVAGASRLVRKALGPLVAALVTSIGVATPATAAGPGDERRIVYASPTAVLAQSGTTRRTPPARATRPAAKALPALLPTTPRSSSELYRDLGSMLNSRTRNGEWGALVVSLTRGDTLFASAADGAFVPASTMKLFTSVLALDRLGPDHAFSTDVLRDGPLTDAGVVEGNLILRGDGDPALSPRYVRGGPSAPMDMLARFVAGAGVRHVTGDLIADATGMEGRRIPEGWLSRYAGAAYAAPFSALSLNENIVIVGVHPVAGGGRPLVLLEPLSSGLEVVSSVRTVPGRAARVTVRMVGESTVTVTGTLGALARPHRVQLVVGDPVTYTAGAFREALRTQGITVDGEVRVGLTPPNSEPVTSLPSPPLSKLVATMNRESINHYAEQIFRNAARGPDRRDAGTAERAQEQLDSLLSVRAGIAPGTVIASDGSGLSVLDRVTPRSLVQLLHHAHHAPWGSTFHASLPVAGESETLRARMRGTAAQGNLHAKTGTTNDVISLAGYVAAENGEILAFSFLYNGKDRWNARETIDAMGATMASFWRQ